MRLKPPQVHSLSIWKGARNDPLLHSGWTWDSKTGKTWMNYGNSVYGQPVNRPATVVKQLCGDQQQPSF